MTEEAPGKIDALSYRAIINKYQKQLEDLQPTIAELNHAIVELAQNNSVLDEKLNEANNTIAQIIQSRGWRTLEKVRKFIPRKKTFDPANTTPITHGPEIINFPPYESHYEDNFDFSKLGYKPEVKAIAFYLPQFHTFKENDKWWGKGFTEWTNTKKSQPRFPNHYQPRTPHDDIGFYALDNADTLKKQVSIAKQHGIYGFCFYYYWFSGKRLMEKPLDILLQNPDIDFPFCLCWANESWTRTWDGLGQNILIEQKYQQNDPANFIKDLKKYLDDPRYIRVDHKPVILIYAPESIPNLTETIEIWRNTARKLGIGEIVIWSKNNILDRDLSNSSLVDGEFDFAPNKYSSKDIILDRNEERVVFDYTKLVEKFYKQKIYSSHLPIKPFYYSCTMGWDNSPRKKYDCGIFANYSPEKFYDWIRLIVEETKWRYEPDKRFTFINAWNEWAEGVYLEPDQRFGYTNINTAAKAIYGLPYRETSDLVILDKKSPTIQGTKNIAIQIHAFYPDIFEQLAKYITHIPFSFDLYISTNSESKKTQILKILSAHKLKAVKTEVVHNVGRDVYPFLIQMSENYKKYDIIGHFHTKRTPQEPYGDAWRSHIYNNLIGSTPYVKRVFTLFNDPKTGLIIPTPFCGACGDMALGSNADAADSLLKKIDLEPVEQNAQIIFPAGTMFWARTKSIEDIFKLKLAEKDFPEEAGQVDGTIAHALERLFGIIPQQKGYTIKQVINKVE